MVIVCVLQPVSHATFVLVKVRDTSWFFLQEHFVDR